jgi:hypothetical protein
MTLMHPLYPTRIPGTRNSAYSIQLRRISRATLVLHFSSLPTSSDSFLLRRSLALPLHYSTLPLTSTMSSGILPSFLGVFQASMAVLLTIGYRTVASRFNMLKESSSRDTSKTCVRLFLPALLISNVGSELHADTALRYVPVLSKSLPSDN